MRTTLILALVLACASSASAQSIDLSPFSATLRDAVRAEFTRLITALSPDGEVGKEAPRFGPVLKLTTADNTVVPALATDDGELRVSVRSAPLDVPECVGDFHVTVLANPTRVIRATGGARVKLLQAGGSFTDQRILLLLDGSTPRQSFYVPPRGAAPLLVIYPDAGLLFTGPLSLTITDRNGKPVPDADVRVNWCVQ